MHRISQPRESTIMRVPLTRKLFRIAGSLRLTFLLYVANYLFCALIFMLMEHRSLVDALWFCTVTWFTVGYGDMVPGTDASKLFTIYAIISSHILIILVTANFVTKLAYSRSYYNRQERQDAYDNSEETNVAAIIS